MYAHAFFEAHFISKEHECTFPKNFIITSQPDKPDDYFELNYETISKQVAVFGIETLTQNNAHFLRNKAINSIYEIIHKYLLQEGKQEMTKYYSYDWFRVLNVLRNSASHADNEGRVVQFPDRDPKWKKNPDKNPIKPYPDTIQWGNIKITRGQKENIRYSDKDLLELFKHIVSFFFNQLDLSKKI